MNVWGSGRSTVLRRMRENIGPAVLSPLFDLPLDQQPAGIAADMALHPADLVAELPEAHQAVLHNASLDHPGDINVFRWIQGPPPGLFR